MSSAQYSNESDLELSCKLSQRRVLKLSQSDEFWSSLRATNSETSSTMQILKLSCKLSQRWVLKLFQQCVFWSSLRDACSEAFVQALSMRRFHCLELSSKFSQCDRFLIYWKMWMTVIAATNFFIEMIFTVRSCIDAKSAETNESIFDNATRLDEKQSRFVWQMHWCLQNLRWRDEMSSYEMMHRYDSWYLKLTKKYIVQQVLFVWALRWRRECIDDSYCDSFDNVIDVSQISQISYFTLRSHWLNIYVIWL